MTSNPIWRAVAFCIPTPSKVVLVCSLLGVGAAFGWLLGMVFWWISGDELEPMVQMSLIAGCAFTALFAPTCLGFLAEKQSSSTILQVILFVPWVLIIVLGTLVAMLEFAAYRSLNPIVDRLKLKAKGRFLSEREWRGKLDHREGTFILELRRSPYGRACWPKRIWWTEDHFQVYPYPENLCVEQVFRDYLEVGQGKALLTDSLARLGPFKSEEDLRQRFPEVNLVVVDPAFLTASLRHIAGSAEK